MSSKSVSDHPDWKSRSETANHPLAGLREDLKIAFFEALSVTVSQVSQDTEDYRMIEVEWSNDPHPSDQNTHHYSMAGLGRAAKRSPKFRQHRGTTSATTSPTPNRSARWERLMPPFPAVSINYSNSSTTKLSKPRQNYSRLVVFLVGYLCILKIPSLVSIQHSPMCSVVVPQIMTLVVLVDVTTTIDNTVYKEPDAPDHHRNPRNTHVDHILPVVNV